MGSGDRPVSMASNSEGKEAVSDRPRCKTTTKVATVPPISSGPARVIRAVCDRPIGHPRDHRGRLIFGNEIIGIYEWEGDI